MLNLWVDWGHNARFDHPDADLSAYVLGAQWSLGHLRPSDGIPPNGTLEVVLENATRRFSPDYATSPLNGLIRRGRRVRLLWDDVLLWSGWLSEVEVRLGRYRERIAILRAEGSFARLQQSAAGLAPQTDVRADEVVAAALANAILNPNALGLFQLDAPAFATLDEGAVIFDPAEHLDLSTAQTRLAYVGDVWDARTTPYDVVADMVAAENGDFWQARDGMLIFRDRHYFLVDSTPPLQVDADVMANAAAHRGGGEWYSAIEVTCFPRVVDAAPQVLWQTSAPLQLLPSSERVLMVNVDAIQSGVLNLAPLVVGEDVFAVDSYGRVQSAYVTASAELYGGGLVRLVLRNTATFPLWVTAILRGTRITTSGAVMVTRTDPSREIAMGRHVLRVVLPMVDSIETAEAYATWRLWRDREPAGGMTHLSLRDRDATWRAHMLAWTLGTRLSIHEYQLGATHPYRIVGEAWAYAPAEGLRVTYTLLPADPNTYCILDQTPLDSGAVGY